MTNKKLHLGIDKERCKECSLCVNVCPRGALAMSEDVNSKGYRYVVLKYPEKCNACGLCVMMCPDSGLYLEEDK